MEKEADNGLALHVAVVGDAIIVTMPGTNYSVTYHKPGKTPWLVASGNRDDFNSPIKQFTFRARACIATNDKARELGWIV
jgi:hypothetical protein